MIERATDIPREQLAAFCRQNAIARLSLFGSILRDDFGPASDVDVLIEFTPQATPSLLDLGRMQQVLCDLLGRQVDLKTPDFLSPVVRERVRRQARELYAA